MVMVMVMVIITSNLVIITLNQVTDCVPDSSNAVEAEEEADDEQHSSGSVDEVTHDNYDDVYDDDFL